MRAATAALYRAAHAHGIVNAAGGRLVHPAKVAAPVGYDTAGGTSGAAVQEFATADGEVIARKVTAAGAVECWLRADLIQPTLDCMAASSAETERITREVAAYAEATRPAPAHLRPVPVLSEGLIHAAMKHSQRIGRFFDMNTRGARERENFSRLLSVARKSDGEN